jgi:hypothetical protein
MRENYIKKNFNIWSKKQRTIIALMIAVLFSSFFTGATVYAEKSNDQIAKELLYGNWTTRVGTEVRYSFNENNLKILNASNVNPMGESSIRVSLKNPDGSWTTNNIVCSVTLEKNQYYMKLIRRNEKGNEVKGNDWGVTYKKVYWTSIKHPD